MPQPATLADLGPGNAVGINDNGQVVASNAVIWNGTTPTILGSIPGGMNGAFGINNAGQVAGYIATSTNNNGMATVWNGTTPAILDTLPGATSSVAFSINNIGQAAGYSLNTSSGISQATIWNGAAPTALDSRSSMRATAGDFSCRALMTSVTKANQIAGRSATLNRTFSDSLQSNAVSITDLKV